MLVLSKVRVDLSKKYYFPLSAFAVKKWTFWSIYSSLFTSHNLEHNYERTYIQNIQPPSFQIILAVKHSSTALRISSVRSLPGLFTLSRWRCQLYRFVLPDECTGKIKKWKSHRKYTQILQSEPNQTWLRPFLKSRDCKRKLFAEKAD